MRLEPQRAKRAGVADAHCVRPKRSGARSYVKRRQIAACSRGLPKRSGGSLLLQGADCRSMQGLFLRVAERRAGHCQRRAGEPRRARPCIAEICRRNALTSGGEASGAPASEKRPCTCTAIHGHACRSGGARRGRARPEWSVAYLCAANTASSVRQPTNTVEAARSAAAVLSPFKQGAGIPEHSPRGPINKGEWA